MSHADNEIARNLLFTAESASLLPRDTQWKDVKGVHVPTEMRGLLTLAVDLTAQKKDALLTCWAAKYWLQEPVDWWKGAERIDVVEEFYRLNFKDI